MTPREPTQEDVEFWNSNGEGEVAVIGPMMGRHIGGQDIMVIRQGDKVRVPWVPDERDYGVDSNVTVWTTFWGGMLATDLWMRHNAASNG